LEDGVVYVTCKEYFLIYAHSCFSELVQTQKEFSSRTFKLFFSTVSEWWAQLSSKISEVSACYPPKAKWQYYWNMVCFLQTTYMVFCNLFIYLFITLGALMTCGPSPCILWEWAA